MRQQIATLSEADEDAIAEALCKHYFPTFNDPKYLDTEEGRHDLQKELRGRLENTRREVIPWLNEACPLDGARVLEIGCGSGSASVALAEMGAQLTGIDILEPVLHVARERIVRHGLSAEFIHANAAEACRRLAGRRFDLIIFYASLEHMTVDERIDSVRSTWEMLEPGKSWCMVETPNRLWHFDGHSACLPFFHWLPDDLAIRYTRFSPRASMRERFADGAPHTAEELCRYGRCMSFHEFDLALGDVRSLDVVSSLRQFKMRSDLRLRLRRSLAHAKKRLFGGMFYEDLLASFCPGLHPGFFDEYLDLIIRKR